MPDEIVSVSGKASYAVYSSLPSSSQTTSVSAGVTGTTQPADTVEISTQGSQGSASKGSGVTYGTFSDRFRYDIDNGLMSAQRPYQASVVTPGSAAAATYSVRGQTRSLVSGSGLAGVQGAIFALRYGGDAPNSATNGIANRQAINAFKRISDQNLPLLSMIG